MKKFIRGYSIFLSHHFFWMVLIACFALSSSFTVWSQTYIDLPIQLDFYVTTSDELDFSRRGVIINASAGILTAGNDSSKLETYLSLGLFFSKFDQNVGNRKFEFLA